MGQITVPIYEGGAVYAATRQAKETLSQQELQTDLQRDKVRAAVVAAWGANQNSVGILRAAKAQVEASEVALAGVREEAKVGQRTTLDVLNAQQALLSARVQLVTAQHDQVVNSYTLLSAVGRLSIRLGAGGAGIRSAGAFRSGQEQVDRSAYARRQVTADDSLMSMTLDFAPLQPPASCVRRSDVCSVCAQAARLEVFVASRRRASARTRDGAPRGAEAKT